LAGRSIEPGRSFENLEVIEELGRGAFATVYRAWDPLAERHVALKVLDTDRRRDAVRERAAGLGEARMVARIDDPHVVMLYNVFEVEGGRLAFALEYMDGGTLADLLRERRPLPEAECRRVLRGILAGLAAAHERGIVHHDVKPANVMLDRKGRVKLGDFGLGRVVEDDDPATSLVAGRRGTALYMAPEVVMGRRGRRAADLWSVGVVLYEMLAGRPPFTGRTDQSLFYEILNASPPPLPDSVPPDLADLALRCLAKAPGDRPASAAALLGELDREGAAARRVDPSVAAAPDLRLVGRRAELAALHDHLAAVRRGDGRAVLVLGEAGVGKTALLQRFTHEVRGSGLRWVEARVSTLEGLRRPLIRAVREQLTDADLTSSSGAVLRRLEEAADGRAPEPPLQTVGELQRVLAGLAESDPAVVVVEDAHLADREETELLTGLCAAIEGAPVLLVLTFRTRDPAASDASDGERAGYHRLVAAPGLVPLELQRLDDAAIRSLVEQASGVAALPLELSRRVVGESEGIPLYALELYRHLEASGEIERVGDTLRLTDRWTKTALPRRLRDMVARRLEGLTEAERTLLETAAVGGVEFDGARLAAVLDEPPLKVLRALQRVYRHRALVVPLERGYRFGHGIFQEAIYEETAPDLRRMLHRAWAERMEADAGAGEVDDEHLGWHWEQADEREKAAPHLAAAARAATRRGEHLRAWDLADRAGALREDLPDGALREGFDLLVHLDSTFVTEADARRAEALLERLSAAARRLGDDRMRRETAVAEAWHRTFRERGRPVDRDAVLDAAEHLPDGEPRGNACWLLGRVAAHEGAFEEARAWVDRAEAIYAACGLVQQDALQHLPALIHRALGDPEAARSAFERSTEALLARTGPSTQAALSRAMALVCASQAGAPEGKGDAMEEPIRWMERSQQEARTADLRSWQAELYEAEGRIPEAWAALRRAEPTLRRGVLTTALWNLLLRKSRLQIAAGELEAAARTIDEAPEHAGSLGPVDLAALDERRAFLDAARGEHDAARARILDALRVVAPTNEYRDLSRLLGETIQLSLLGVDLSQALPILEDLAARADLHPVVVDLPLGVARVVLSRDLADADGARLERAVATARNPRMGSQQATMAVFARLLWAQVQLLAGESESAALALTEVAGRARRLDHVWLELRAFQVARDADLAVDPSRVRAIAERIRDQNTGDPQATAAVLRRWTAGLGRA